MSLPAMRNLGFTSTDENHPQALHYSKPCGRIACTIPIFFYVIFAIYDALNNVSRNRD